MVLKITTTRDHILEFLHTNHVAVLATADQTGTPHAAAVYITYDQALNFYFTTKRDTQKGRNLADNPRVSMTLFDAITQTTVQGDGVVIEVTDTDQAERIFNEIQMIARRTSVSGIPPTTEIEKGGYVTYRLSLPNIHMIQFGQPETSSHGMFDIAL
jgi:general stress protein 26